MYSAYLGFYPRQTILKTWKAMGVKARTTDEAFALALEARDQFLLDNDGMASLEIEIDIRKGSQRYCPLADPKAALAAWNAKPIDRTRFPKANGGSNDAPARVRSVY